MIFKWLELPFRPSAFFLTQKIVLQVGPLGRVFASRSHKEWRSLPDGVDLQPAHHLLGSVNIPRKKRSEKHLKREQLPFLTFLYFAQTSFPTGSY